MRAKVYATYFSLAFTIVSTVLIVISLIIHCLLLKDIAFSIIGSALVSLFISLTDYFAVKRETLEEAYLSALKFNDLIFDINYLYFKDEYTLLIKYNSEKRKNSHLKQFGQPVEDSEYTKIVAFYRIENLSESEKLLFLQQKENDFKNNINKIAISVRAAIEYGTDNLSHAYGKMYYLFDCCKAKQQSFYQKIYQPLFELDCFLNDINYSFDQYYKYKESNYPMATDAIKKLNDRLFEVSENKDIEPANLLVYKKFYSEMRNKIERLRVSINNKEEFEPKPDQIDSFMILE